MPVTGRSGTSWPVWLPVLLIAVVIGAAAAVGSIVMDEPMADPEGSFLGPSWVRLPVLCGAAVLADLLPRALWLGRLHPARAVRRRLCRPRCRMPRILQLG